jgi:hypothetical protein
MSPLFIELFLGFFLELFILKRAPLSLLLETKPSRHLVWEGGRISFFFPPPLGLGGRKNLLVSLILAFLPHEVFGVSWFRVFSNPFCHRLVQFISYPPKIATSSPPMTCQLLCFFKLPSPFGSVLSFQFLLI